jgi:hypothetical protein
VGYRANIMRRPNAKALVSASMPALASLNSLARSIIRLRAGNPLLLELGSTYMVATCWASELLENKAVFFSTRFLDLGLGPS